MNSLLKMVIKQFGHPEGLLGEIAGLIMATRKSNLERNAWTVDLLDLKPDDKVLEIGPGPGVTLQRILQKVTNGGVVALDHSTVMLKQCQRRNRKAVQEGRLELVEGDYADLPDLPGPFSHIIAVNSLQFSGMKDQVLESLHKMLAPSGKLAVTYQPRGANPTNEAGAAFAEQAQRSLESAGFSETHLEILGMKPINVFCIVAMKCSPTDRLQTRV